MEDNNTTFNVSGVTVGPTCYVDDRKTAKKKSRFTLLKAAMVMLRSNPNQKSKQNKNPKNNINIVDNKNTNDDNNNNNADGQWKNIVGSMRPLHMQAQQYPSPRTPVSISDESAPSSPSLSTTSSSMTSKYASANNLQELAGTETKNQQLTRKHSMSVGNLPELGTTGTNHLHKLVSTGTMTQSRSMGNLHELATTNTGAMSRYASALNLHDLDLDEKIDEEDDGGDDNVLEHYDADVMIDSKADQFIAQFYQQIKSQHKGRKHGH